MSLDSKSRASKHHWVGHRIKRPHFWEVGFILRGKEMRDVGNELCLSVDMFVCRVEKNQIFKLALVRNPASKTWKISPQNMPLGMCCLSVLACRNSFRVWRPCPGRNPDSQQSSQPILSKIGHLEWDKEGVISKHEFQRSSVHIEVIWGNNAW